MKFSSTHEDEECGAFTPLTQALPSQDGRVGWGTGTGLEKNFGFTGKEPKAWQFNLFWHFWGFTVLRHFSPHILMIFFVWISLSLLSQNQWSFGFVSLHTGLLGHFLCYRTLTTPSWLCPSLCFQKTFCLLSFRYRSPQASWVPWTSHRLPFCHINPELYFPKSDPHYHCKPPSQESGYHNHPLLFLPTISSS